MKKRRTPVAHSATGFVAVSLRQRQDGWTPARQVAFVEALGECGCVDEACRRVGMGTSSAYALRRRPEANSFRMAWDAALDVAIERLADAAFARAIKGVATPVFYKGEQVGERVRHDERLTMFLLRYRAPVRYGAVDGCRAEREPDGAATALAAMVEAIATENPLPPHAAPAALRYRSPRAQAADDDLAERERMRGCRATPEETDAAILKALAAIAARKRDSGGDVACGSSTSASPPGSDQPSSRSVAGSRAPP